MTRKNKNNASKKMETVVVKTTTKPAVSAGTSRRPGPSRPARQRTSVLGGPTLTGMTPTPVANYRVTRNSVMNGRPVPSFSKEGDGVRVVHREFIQDVIGNTAFTNLQFPVNPGLSGTFPWLSTLAYLFEEYDFEGLVFEYRPSSGSAISSTSSALGVVVMATDYDSLNPVFSSKQAMESYEYATSSLPYQRCIHPVECKKGRNVLDNLYVRSSQAPSGSDLRFYDLGKFQLAVAGMQSSYTVGELWCGYDVKLRKPRINPSGLPPPNPGPDPGQARLELFRISSGGGNATFTEFFGPTPFVFQDLATESISHVAGGGGGGRILLKRSGIYLAQILIQVSGADATMTANIDPGDNLDVQSPLEFSNRTEPLIAVHEQNGGSVTGTSISSYFTVKVDGTGLDNVYSLSLNGGVGWSTLYTDLIVTRIADYVAPFQSQVFPAPLMIPRTQRFNSWADVSDEKHDILRS